MDSAPEPLTRCGYTPRECLTSFSKALAESGAFATGRALHFAADILCSGGMEALLGILWNYALFHIGVASPRIFVYLQKRVSELRDMRKRVKPGDSLLIDADDVLYTSQEFQVRVGEMLLVLRDVPTRPPLTWPKVGMETHTEGWLHSISTAPETDVLRRVWTQSDLPILRLFGAELLAAVAAGSTEKAMFWIRWVHEEEAKHKREVKGGTFTSTDRLHGAGGNKKGCTVGLFIAALFAEAYKDYARKGLVRMHEEFQTLYDIYRDTSTQKLPGPAKKYCLALMAAVLCEVPRWKVPAAPSLIQDPVKISRAVSHVPKFFQEVLAYSAPPKGVLAKLFKARGLGEKAKKKIKAEQGFANKIDAMNALFEQYINSS